MWYFQFLYNITAAQDRRHQYKMNNSTSLFVGVGSQSFNNINIISIIVSKHIVEALFEND